MTEPTTLYQRPAELLQNLIRFDTTNPPGNEAECIAYIDGLLQSLGIETTILAKEPARANLIARLKGTGSAPPLLLYGHVDVVSTAGQKWTHPPFSGDLIDGYIWGRGALDMKSGVAMLLAAFMRAKAENLSLPGDVILCIVSDEEVDVGFGVSYLVAEHAEQFEGVRYALGEFGGFAFYVGDKRFYPIMTAEKQVCWMRATIRGPGGHGSTPLRGGATARLAKFLHTLDRKRLPVHITPIARQMIETMAAELPRPTRTLLSQLLNPMLTDRVLDLLGERGRTFNPMLHNTATPTMLKGGTQVNVIPAEITVDLDGRLLPGFSPDDMLRELRNLVGDDVELEVVLFQPGPLEPDMGMYNMLASVLREADPTGIPTPLLLSGVTDGRHFAKLGIQTYGFLPMQLPPDFNFAQTIHAADERIPADALDFGADAIYTALQRF
jgi:acetylornithine deacetylase/succinyl-diaminopimelate desuccinylase-like protein